MEKQMKGLSMLKIKEILRLKCEAILSNTMDTTLATDVLEEALTKYPKKVCTVLFTLSVWALWMKLCSHHLLIP